MNTLSKHRANSKNAFNYLNISLTYFQKSFPEFQLPEMLPAERERPKEIKEPEDSGATVASSSQLSSSRRALVKEREGE